MFFSVSGTLGHNDKRKRNKTEKTTILKVIQMLSVMYHHPSPLCVTSKKQDCQEYFQAHEIFFFFLIRSVFIFICFAYYSSCHFTSKQHVQIAFLC